MRGWFRTSDLSRVKRARVMSNGKPRGLAARELALQLRSSLVPFAACDQKLPLLADEMFGVSSVPVAHHREEQHEVPLSLLGA